MTSRVAVPVHVPRRRRPSSRTRRSAWSPSAVHAGAGVSARGRAEVDERPPLVGLAVVVAVGAPTMTSRVAVPVHVPAVATEQPK